MRFLGSCRAVCVYVCVWLVKPRQHPTSVPYDKAAALLLTENPRDTSLTLRGRAALEQRRKQHGTELQSGPPPPTSTPTLRREFLSVCATGVEEECASNPYATSTPASEGSLIPSVLGGRLPPPPRPPPRKGEKPGHPSTRATPTS